MTQSTSDLLNAEQLEAMGAHFLQVLLAMKHNGAIDKTRTGFIALCDRLLRSPDSRLSTCASFTNVDIMHSFMNLMNAL